MTPGQLFAFRPVPGHARYRTPLPGLYLCGAATHPGGGVMGTPGLNAAREILGRRSDRWRTRTRRSIRRKISLAAEKKR
jgi:phytoene dehydrogenase-like protein